MASFKRKLSSPVTFLLLVYLSPIMVEAFSRFPAQFGAIPVSKAPRGRNGVSSRHPTRIGRSNNRSSMSSRRATASSQDTQEGLDRNMFQAGLYSKPIVLLGVSGSGQEIRRLAKSLRNEMAPTKGDHEGVIHASDIQSVDTLLADIHDSRVKFPDIIALDFAEGDSSDCAKALYDAGLLSIYVNVHPEESEMSQNNKKLKAEIEENILVAYSDYELCIRDEGLASDASDADDWSHLQWELNRLVARAMLQPAIPGDKTRTTNTAHLTMGAHTFFLSLSFPDISECEPYVQDMCRDVDAMEYRADLLDCRDSRFDLIYGQQLLRKYCRPYAVRGPGLPFGGTVIDDVMPTLYTVRTKNQAGTYPDDEAGISKMFQLLEWGLRSGVEVLDVESAWDFAQTSKLLSLTERRYSSQILGSHHVVGEEVTLEDAVMLFQQCAMNGRAHGAKVVLSITSDERDRLAYEAAMIAQSLAAEDGDPVIPCISLILGEVGQFSRVINIPFTPVTHEALPFKAAPGQMTANEIAAARLLTKIMRPKRYAILGHNIAYSVSPQMQGAAFAATRLPHEYYRADVETVEEFVQSDFFKADTFGGCSITIPHKQSIIPYVDVMSDAAKEIGSVNTLIVREEIGSDQFERVIYGENTDWRGIFNPLKRKLGQTSSGDCALILGAGGTARAAAYAASKLGLSQIYYNRTPEKAADLAESFGGTVVSDLGTEDDKSLGGVLRATGDTVRVVISTLPAAAEFELPGWMIESDRLPIVFDVNYKPFNTKLLLQSELAGCEVVRGSEMLWEQGVGQFELWTERTAPYRVMKDVVLENCLPSQGKPKSRAPVGKDAMAVEVLAKET